MKTILSEYKNFTPYKSSKILKNEITYNSGINLNRSKSGAKSKDTNINRPQSSNNIRQNYKALTVSNSNIYDPGLEKVFNNVNSPIIEGTYEDPTKINQLDDVQKLKKLFLLYSSNENKLQSQKYLKLLSDAKLLDKGFDSKYAEVIFLTASRSKNFILFNEFCEIIVKISEIKFSVDFMKNQSKALDKIMSNFLFPLLNIILEANKISQEKNKFNLEIYLSKMNTGANTYYILKHFYCISKIYEKYFPWENLKISNYQKSKLSEKTYVKFCKDFEICPHIATIVKANEIFQSVMMNTRLLFNMFDAIKAEEDNINLKVYSENVSNKGTYFTLYHLIAALYLFSVNNMCSVNNYRNEIIISGFTNEEDSIFFNHLIQKFYKTEAIKSIFPKENILSGDNTFKTLKNCNQPIPSESHMTFNNFENDYGNLPDEIESQNKKIKFNTLNYKSTKFSDFNSQSNISIELDTIFFEKYQEFLVTVYKHYSDIFSDTNYSIYMNYNGFIKFMNDIGLLYLEKSKNIQSAKTPILIKNKTTLNEKLKSNLFSMNTLNLLFSKYTNESSAVNSVNSKLHVNKNKSTSKDFPGKKINFSSFIKILLCIANKLFNSKFNTVCIEAQRDFNLDKLIQSYSDSKQMQEYLDMFICNYIKPCYNEIRTFLERESYDLMLLDKILHDGNVDTFFAKMRPVLHKIFLLYTDGKENIDLEEFFKFCTDFEIFPDLVTKTKIFHLFINFVRDFDTNNVIKGDPYFYIGFDQFLGIIIFIAIGSKLGSIVSEDLVLFKRILYFFQRMIQSEGIKKTVLTTGSSKISSEFSNIFNKFKSALDDRPNTRKKFSEIIRKK